MDKPRNKSPLKMNLDYIIDSSQPQYGFVSIFGTDGPLGAFGPMHRDEFLNIDEKGENLFHHVATRYYVGELVVRYLEEGRRLLTPDELYQVVNHRNKQGFSALEIMAYRNVKASKAIETLIRSGLVSWNKPNVRGRTPMWYALAGMQPKANINVFRQFGATLDSDIVETFPESKQALYPKFCDVSMTKRSLAML